MWNGGPCRRRCRGAQVASRPCPQRPDRPPAVRRAGRSAAVRPMVRPVRESGPADRVAAFSILAPGARPPTPASRSGAGPPFPRRRFGSYPAGAGVACERSPSGRSTHPLEVGPRDVLVATNTTVGDEFPPDGWVDRDPFVTVRALEHVSNRIWTCHSDVTYANGGQVRRSIIPWVI